MKKETKNFLIGLIVGSIFAPIIVNIITPYFIFIIYPKPTPNLHAVIGSFEVYNESTCPQKVYETIISGFYFTHDFRLYQLPLNNKEKLERISQSAFRCVLITNMSYPEMYFALNITNYPIGCPLSNANPCKEYYVNLVNEGASIASDIFVKLITTKEIEYVSFKEGMSVGTQIIKYKNERGFYPKEEFSFYFTTTGSIKELYVYDKEEGQIENIGFVEGKQLDCSCIANITIKS